MQKLNLTKETMAHIETDIEAAEKELDDDAESIITNERYVYIASRSSSAATRRSPPES